MNTYTTLKGILTPPQVVYSLGVHEEKTTDVERYSQVVHPTLEEIKVLTKTWVLVLSNTDDVITVIEKK